MTVIRDKKNDYLIGFTKNMSLIKELVNKSLYPLLNNKNIAEMWIFFKNKF